VRLALLVAAVSVALGVSASPASAFVCQGDPTDVPRFCTYVGIYNKTTSAFTLTDTRTSAGSWFGNCPSPLIPRSTQPNSQGAFVDCAMGASDAPGGSATGGASWALQTGGGRIALDFKFTPGDPPNTATLTCDSTGAAVQFDCPYFQWNANDSAKPPPPDGFPATSMRIYVHIYPASHRTDVPTPGYAHPRAIAASRLARRGLPIAVDPTHGGRVTAELRRGRRTHGRVSKAIPVPDERHRLRLRLNRAGRRALGPGRYRLVLRFRSRFGESSTLTRRVRVR
jgi:hypothetical protein